MRRIAVIGGGPAGMMAAYAAAYSGAEVTLIEKNEKLGKKLFITGKGRCNITNSAYGEDFFHNIVRNRKFMYSAYYSLSNTDLVEMLNANGLKTKEERGGRIFPASDKSSDVIKTLKKMLADQDVQVKLNTEIKDIVMENGNIKYLSTSKGKIFADAYILATGGISYPKTGSTGDGHKMAKKAGHSVSELIGSLVPMESADDFCKELQGLSLKNVKVSLFCGKKLLYSDMGEMLFTHFGVSGPLILSASAHITKYDFADMNIVIDLKPALDKAVLDARLLRDFSMQKNKQLKNALDELLPKRLIPIIISASKLDGEKQVNSITKEERLKLEDCLKNFKIKISGLRPVDEAIVTRGGIVVKDINPSTMQSKVVENLYFSGEIVDIDAYTGGFNLQIAFSTGYLAGISSALQSN